MAMSGFSGRGEILLKGQRSELIYNLGNNLITIANLQGSIEILNTYENFFVGEVMNEITHLPYDTFLIPFLKGLGIKTSCKEANDVLFVNVWDLNRGYLNDNRVGHMDGLSVQSDATVILKDYIALFEFKRPHKAPSKNHVTLEQLGRQVLLALKYKKDYGIKNFKILLINNSAPKVHIPKIGKILPNEIIGEYFLQREDKWLQHSSVVRLMIDFDESSLADIFHVITWNNFIEKVLASIELARKSYDNAGIEQMLLNSRVSIEWFFERRKGLLATE